MGLQPARLKQENNVSLMYMHRFCKVVTSGSSMSLSQGTMYMHRFCKVVTSEAQYWRCAGRMYMHRFCKVVTSGTMTSRLSTTVVVTSKVSHAQ